MSAHPPGSTPASLLFAERRNLVLAARLPATVEKQALSMCTLDEATNPDVLRERGLGDLGTAIQRLTQFLVFRALERAAWARHEHEFEPPVAEDDRHRPLAIEVEARLRAAIQAAFPAPVTGPAFGVRDFEQAFAAFVTGEIGMHAIAGVAKDHPLFSHGIPDSANHFCFAEAAFYFVRLGLQPRFWMTTLPTLVGTAQFFAAGFWDRRTRAWTSYDCTNLRRAAATSQAVLAAIDHYWRALTLGQLAEQFGLLLAVSLRDDRSLGHPNHCPREFS